MVVGAPVQTVPQEDQTSDLRAPGSLEKRDQAEGSQRPAGQRAGGPAPQPQPSREGPHPQDRGSPAHPAPEARAPTTCSSEKLRELQTHPLWRLSCQRLLGGTVS